MKILLTVILLAGTILPPVYGQAQQSNPFLDALNNPDWPVDWPRQWIPRADPAYEDCRLLIGVVYDALQDTEIVSIDDPREGIVLKEEGKPYLDEEGGRTKLVKKWNPFLPRLSMIAVGDLMAFSTTCASKLLTHYNNNEPGLMREFYSADEMITMYYAHGILHDLTLETSLRTLEYGRKVKEHREKILLIANRALSGCYARSALPPPRTDPMDEILGMSTKEFDRLLMFGVILENLRHNHH